MKSRGAPCGLSILALLYSIASQPGYAQPAAFKVLHTFAGTLVLQTNAAGAKPDGDLVSADGVLYGTATSGGYFGEGTVFKINADGSGLATLYSFTAARVNGQGVVTNSDGASPRGRLILSGDKLYGIAGQGGAAGSGALFRINTDGADFTNLYTFSPIIPVIYRNTNNDGAYPEDLILSGNALYGTTLQGGTGGNGTLFRINMDGSGFTNLHSFTASPSGSLVLLNYMFYGTTASGGSSGNGTVFSLNTDGSAFATLHDFAGSDGAAPYGGLVLSGNTLFGTASRGGSSGSGTLFSLNANGTGFTNLYSFTARSGGTNLDGASPQAGLSLSGNTLFGTASRGGGSGSGTVFSVITNGSGFTVLYSFTALLGGNPGGTFAGTNNDGAVPQAGLALSGNALFGMTSLGGPSGNGVLFAVNTIGPGYTNLYAFGATEPDLVSSDGSYPVSSLILSANTLFGTTYLGGGSGRGTVFSVNADGSGYTQLHSFVSSVDGEGPNNLVLSGDRLIGATSAGGSPDYGTVFSVNTNGSGFTKVFNFVGRSGQGAADGAAISVLSSNTLYGTIGFNGSWGSGAVFKIGTSGGGFTELYDFTALLGSYPWTNFDGARPNSLILSGNTFYGTTLAGGSFGQGTVFRVDRDGTAFTNLHSFTPLPGNYVGTNSDGAEPEGRLTLSGNTLFGTASLGGKSGSGTVFSLDTDGTEFRTLYNFGATSDAGSGYANSDGAGPRGLILSGKTFYGTTGSGGMSGLGTIFQINTDGSGFRSLYSFTGGADGGLPQAAPILFGNTLYGTASAGGDFGSGTVFSLTLPPVPLALGKVLAGNQIILSWPVSATNYVLQTSRDLTSGSWTDITSGIGMVAGNYVFTNAISGVAFFRLKLP